ncbi:hypothetical protein MBLNU230_g6780t1 [Neophaeotheca triangularis]
MVQLSGFALLVLAGLTAVLAQRDENAAPIQIQYDVKIDGPDGPWNAINQSVGDPEQYLPMYPAISRFCLVTAEEACKNAEPDGIRSCPAPIPELWKDVRGTESQIHGLNAFAGYGPIVLRLDGDHRTMAQPMTLRDATSQRSFILPASNMGIKRSENLTVNFRGAGASYTVAVGWFGLQDGEVVWETTDGEEPTAVSVLTNARDRGFIPSTSFALHAGSATYGMNGSLVLGGYDSSRFLTEPIRKDGFTVDLKDISVNVSSGVSSAFKAVPQGGLLINGDGEMYDSVEVHPTGEVPYMYLPESVCNAISAYLPVRYDTSLSLYLWNTDDEDYHRITSSLHYLTFTFASQNSTSDYLIRVPFALLNLNLTAPLRDEPTPYFPCSPWDLSETGNKAIFGRAFLQAATWARIVNNTVVQTFLSQAPGPSKRKGENIVRLFMQDSSISLDSDNPSWEDSWLGVLGPPADDSLSTGAMVGIVVAVVAVVSVIVGIFLWRYLRRRKAGRSQSDGGQVPVVSSQRADYQADVPPFEKANGDEINELDALGGVVELDHQGHRTERAELPANDRLAR